MTGEIYSNTATGQDIYITCPQFNTNAVHPRIADQTAAYSIKEYSTRQSHPKMRLAWLTLESQYLQKELAAHDYYLYPELATRDATLEAEKRKRTCDNCPAKALCRPRINITQENQRRIIRLHILNVSDTIQGRSNMPEGWEEHNLCGVIPEAQKNELRYKYSRESNAWTENPDYIPQTIQTPNVVTPKAETRMPDLSNYSLFDFLKLWWQSRRR